MNRGTGTGDDGFTIVEVIVAVVLLGFLAIAILPALVMGLSVASDQSSKATAIRAANTVIEEARMTPTCGGLAGAAAARTVTDGSGKPLIVSATVGACAPGAAVPFTVTVSPGAGEPAAVTTRALIFVP